MIRSSIVLFVLSQICSLGSAQTTWIVDPENGPGAHFIDLQPAIDAALPGDTIHLVNRDAATMLPVTSAVVNKALTIVGGINPLSSPGAVNGCTFFRGLLEIRDIPAGQRCVVSSLCFVNPVQTGPPTWFEPWGIRLRNCAGQVHFERTMHTNGEVVNGSFLVEDCAAVVFQGDVSAFTTLNAPGGSMTFRRSHVLLSGYWIHNRGVKSVSNGPPPLGSSVAAPADTILVEDGTLRIVDSVVEGADAEVPMWQPSGFFGTHAIALDNSLLEIGPGSILRGGTSQVGSSTFRDAIVATNGSRIVFDPRSGHSGIVGAVPVYEPISAIARGQVVRNQSYRVDLYGPFHGLAILVGGGATLAPVPFPFGDVGIDPSWARTMAVVPLDQFGIANLTFFASRLLPMDYLFGLQAALLDSNGALTITEVNRFSVQWQAGLMPP